MSDIIINNSPQDDGNTVITPSASLVEIQTAKADTLTYKNEASLSATNASASEVNASASESSSSASATIATNAAASAAASEATIALSLTNAGNYADSASTSATNSATSATDSANSATVSSGHATTASGYKDTAVIQAGIATTKASEASVSASEALSSRNESQVDRIATAAILAEFQSIYHGTQTSDPTGGTVSDGDLYYNSNTDTLMLRAAGLWDVAVPNVANLYTKIEVDNLLADKQDAVDFTNANIKLMYEANLDTNAFTDTQVSKLAAIEEGAEVNHTFNEIKAGYEALDNTNAYTDDEKTKLSGIEVGATADQIGSEIKIAYEGEANTNAYDDISKAKVDNIYVTDSVDLDELKQDHIALVQLQADANEPTGFIREYRETLGVMELCVGQPLGYSHKKIIRIDHNGETSILDSATFYDGSIANDREFAIMPLIYTGTVDVISDESGATTNRADTRDVTINSGNYYSIYVEGIKTNIVATQKVTFPNQSGLQFVYHEADGTLGLAQTFSFEYFEDFPITATVYGNAVDQQLVNFGDERHGIQMDGFTHRYLHFTQGTQYVDGMAINGLAGGSTVYTNIGSGKAYDEDIYMLAQAQTDAPHLWLQWDATEAKNVWRIEDDGVDIAYTNGGNAKWNESITGQYQLTDVTGNDCMIVFFVLTNNREYPYVKIVGQDLYANVGDARQAVGEAINDLVTSGLPSPEFLPIGAVIVDRDGELKLLSDGSTHVDLRTSKLSGAGTSSIPVSAHNDLTNRDSADAHPANAISYDNTTSGLTATTVKDAIDEVALVNSAIITEW